jgi:hypothetical protein
MGEVGALSEKCNLLESQKVEAEILARDAVGRLKQREVMVASLTEKVRGDASLWGVSHGTFRLSASTIAN